MSKSIKSRIDEVREWLNKHVKVLPEPKIVTLFDFTVNWDEFSGDFSVSLDDEVLPDKLRFGLQASGKTIIYMPMFHSPLGVPASYAAIEFSEKTHEAILKGLHETIPRIRGLGIDIETGKEILWTIPVQEDRIPPTILNEAREKVTKEYSIKINI